MKLFKFVSCGLLMVMLLFSAGCGLFDSKIPKNDTSPIPDAAGSPDDLNIDGGSVGKWGAGADDSSMGVAQGDWRPRTDIKFPTVYFSFDRDIIGATERTKIEKVAKYLNENQQLGLIVEGHCDDRGTIEYNRALGERRANAVKNYIASLGVSPNRIKTISYGEDRPAVPGTTPEARAKNRRAELVPADMK
ncbi:OmpA family protein [Lentisphaerota bacterium ZTH]|nr:OmpA family protein [Lentisphaerota bacterium ZTH]